MTDPSAANQARTEDPPAAELLAPASPPVGGRRAVPSLDWAAGSDFRPAARAAFGAPLEGGERR